MNTDWVNARPKLVCKSHRAKKNYLLCETCLLFVLALSLYLMCAIISQTRVGALGAFVAAGILMAFGKSALLLPALLIVLVYLCQLYFVGKAYVESSFRSFVILKGFAASLTILAVAACLSFFKVLLGGMVGDFVVLCLLSWVGSAGTFFVLSFCLLMGTSLLTGISWFELLAKVGKGCFRSNQDREYYSEFEQSIKHYDISCETNSGQCLTDTNHSDICESTENKIEGFLFEFGIRSKVVNIQTGPTISRYDLALAPGVKSNQEIGRASCRERV